MVYTHDVTIIIISWNAKLLLSDCLRSLTIQETNHQVEILVVDNASTDGSPESVQTEFPHVKLICNKSNLGFARANNIGMKQSLAKYICLVNSDVVMPKDGIEKMCNYMDEHPEIGILGPQILSPNMSLQVSCKRFPSLWNGLCEAIALNKIFPKVKQLCGENMLFFSHREISTVDSVAGCLWMMRKSALNETGLFDESFFFYSEDTDLCKRFWNKGWQVVFYPETQVIHHDGGSSSNDPLRFYLEKHRSRFKYWKKHHSRSEQLGFLLLSFLNHTIRILSCGLLYVTRPSKRNHILPKIKQSFACAVWLLHPSEYLSNK